MIQLIKEKDKYLEKENLDKILYLDNENYLNIISDVKSSKYRQKALEIFMKGEEVKIPSEMSKILGIGMSHTSKILNDLKKHGLIICINEKDKKNKKHKITELGKTIGNIIQTSISTIKASK